MIRGRSLAVLDELEEIRFRLTDAEAELLALIETYHSFDWATFLSAPAAIAAAIGAVLLARHYKKKDELLKELGNVNAAIMLTFNITNSYISLKKQYVKQIGETYAQQVAEQAAFQEQLKRGEIQGTPEFHYYADFQMLYPIHTPIDLLEKIVFDRASITGGALALVASLKQCIAGLTQSIVERNNLIKGYREQHQTDEKIARLYFGLPFAEGRVDASYPNSIKAITLQTDDCIFFSKHLGESLNKYGQGLAKKYGKKAPKVTKIEFTKAYELGLMPDDEEYKEVLGFQNEIKGDTV